MRKILLGILIFILVVIVSFAFFMDDRAEEEMQAEGIQRVKIANAVVNVNVASTIAAWGQGLSGRESLAEDEGMLFVFDTPAPRSFYMKDMNFPIDIIWLNEKQEIVYIKENATPESYPEEVFTPDENAKYVLEVVAGFVERNNLEEGDVVEFLN